MAALDGSTVVHEGAGVTPPVRAGPTPDAGLLDSEANALIDAFERALLDLEQAGRAHSGTLSAEKRLTRAELDARRAAYDDRRQDLRDALTGINLERYSQRARDLGPPPVDPAEVLA